MVGEEDANLATSGLPQGAAPLPRHPDRAVASLREGALVEDKHPIGGGKARGHIPLDGGARRLVVPWCLGQQPLQRGRRRLGDGLGHVLGVAPVSLLHEQAAPPSAQRTARNGPEKWRRWR